MRFRFSLESVLKHRKRLEEVAQKEFAEAQANVDAAMRKIEEMYTRMDEVREEIQQAQARGTGSDLEQIRDMESFLVGQARRIEAARLGLRELMAIAEDKQELLIEAARERKILDKLKERKKTEHGELARKVEAKELDDLTTIRQAWGEKMSADGYKQFFKKAKAAQQDKAPASSTRSERVSFRLEQMEKNDRTEKNEQRLRKALNVKSNKRKAPFPWKALVGLGLSVGLAVLYLSAPEKLESLADRIEIHAFGSAKASEGKAAEKSKESKPKTEKSAAEAAGKETGKGPEEKSAVSSDTSHFEKLRQRKEELDRREKELVELEEELQRQKVELDKRISQLEEMRNQIAQILKDRVDVDQEKVNKLVELYSNMKPKQAADVIGSINEDLAVEILAKMKKKNAAEIMNLLPPEKSKVLSEKYTGYRRNHSEPKG